MWKTFFFSLKKDIWLKTPFDFGSGAENDSQCLVPVASACYLWKLQVEYLSFICFGKLCKIKLFTRRQYLI